MFLYVLTRYWRAGFLFCSQLAGTNKSCMTTHSTYYIYLYVHFTCLGPFNSITMLSW
ncbi:hypothetical protein BDQ94DRAFT_151119 [Aspergillus welwitschiae]|uniref:Uncharacterized protein n=1 Tax=Aspergillus welwitschiae TaxID=1341132 RepID=A0A3F3PQE2_9EURO|nr:hypothetical protein BDQ94DRAFT_151119 [Aspergillus welwitschiae]RDH29169.1 hypothetical protein BDQ94DRAFT_151119 [Aspergillus welwitschiae]